MADPPCGRIAFSAETENGYVRALTGVVRVCGPESIDHVVTDAPLPAACRSAVDAAGIEVTIA